jgi:hypothetical protein
MACLDNVSSNLFEKTNQTWHTDIPRNEIINRYEYAAATRPFYPNDAPANDAENPYLAATCPNIELELDANCLQHYLHDQYAKDSLSRDAESAGIPHWGRRQLRRNFLSRLHKCKPYWYLLKPRSQRLRKSPLNPA